MPICLGLRFDSRTAIDPAKWPMQTHGKDADGWTAGGLQKAGARPVGVLVSGARMEWGPTRVGKPLAAGRPRREGLCEVINNKVKCREAFRPFTCLSWPNAQVLLYYGPAFGVQFTVQVRPPPGGTLPAVTCRRHGPC